MCACRAYARDPRAAVTVCRRNRCVTRVPPVLGPLFLVGLGLLAALALGSLLAFLFTQLNNSGRGLDTDEWEVDHSVWMDQLQKDFEESWSVQ